MKKVPSQISITTILGLWIALIVFPVPVGAEMRNINKVLAGTPPFQIIKKVLSSNEESVTKGYVPSEHFAPYITWLTDPDARIQPNLIMAKPENNVYTSRNMGAQVEIAKGQLDYGIRHLHTPILLITLNSDNQAIKFFREGYGELSPSIRTELDHLHLAIENRPTKGKPPKTLLDNIEANIDYQVTQAVNRYKNRIKLGRLDVLGSIADYENVYKRGKGRLIIININGEKDAAKLRSLPIMKSINPKLIQVAIGRQRPKQITMPNTF